MFTADIHKNIPKKKKIKGKVTNILEAQAAQTYSSIRLFLSVFANFAGE